MCLNLVNAETLFHERDGVDVLCAREDRESNRARKCLTTKIAAHLPARMRVASCGALESFNDEYHVHTRAKAGRALSNLQCAVFLWTFLKSNSSHIISVHERKYYTGNDCFWT